MTDLPVHSAAESGATDPADERWNARVDAFWETADDTQPERVLSEMSALVAERADDDAAGLYEMASAHDFLGHEAEAIPLYRAALAAGLDAVRAPQARIQLASSLRNVGEAEAAVSALTEERHNPITGSAASAFLALALRDAGRGDAALRVALEALIPTLPMYQRSLSEYATALDPTA